MSPLGRRSSFNERMEGDPSAFISVLINGNCFQFLDKYVRNGRDGGAEAATALIHAIGQWLLKSDYEVMPLAVRVSGNHEWLSDAYHDAGVIPSRNNFGWFLEGFNSVESLVEFIPIEDRMSVPAYRGRGLCDALKVNLLDPHCKLILFGGVIDERVVSIFHDYHTAIQKLIVFKNCRGIENLANVSPNLRQCWFQGIFQDAEHRPFIRRPTPVIYRNWTGQRIDPHIRPLESVNSWLRQKKFCNNHFLRGDCPDDHCMARHDGQLDTEQLNGLRYLARGLPCRQTNSCRDPICFAGHHCPVPNCRQVNCRFYEDMHITDLRITWEDRG